MNRQIMTIRQLADRAGVTQRTIRYYTDEGLIDAPVDKVRMPRYTERHLLQLQAAAHLKAGYLPLRVIRARLAGLGDEELREIVSSVPQPVAVIVANTSIQEIEASHRVGNVISGSNVALYDGTDSEESTQPEAGERRWHRVVIDDGIEIHFRDDRHLLCRPHAASGVMQEGLDFLDLPHNRLRVARQFERQTPRVAGRKAQG
jgi:DNA-binding transcriptional MerR regulator